MRILITGGAGFIGSHLSECLLKAGHEISILDDLNDFYSPALKLDNLREISGLGQIVFHKVDIRDPSAVSHAVSEQRPDVIVHLAARAGVRPSIQQPLLYEEVNVRGTMILLEAARHYGVKRFVFASSSSVYGIANNIPFSEEDHLTLPVSPYAATKIAGEKICHTYSHLYGLNVVCLRFFTVYGPRQRPDLAIHKFTRKIMDGEPLQVFGDGSSGRDYTFIDDIVQGIMAALNFDCRYEVFNLGNSQPVSLAMLIRTLEVRLGIDATIDSMPDQPGDVPITFANISKAKRVLGYRPVTSFADGIDKFISWYFTRSPVPQ
jgi:UDP-glucuronate 4-epimerase